MIKNVFLIAILFCDSINVVQLRECDINVDRALYENCMPVPENFENGSRAVSTPQPLLNETEADFSRALSTMNFYRKKYNEYLCSNFVSNEILKNFVQRSQQHQPRIGKGIENESHEIGSDENVMFPGNETSYMDDKSAFYKNSKLNELQDLGERNAKQSFNNNYRKMDNNPLGYANSRFDVADITGYAFPITTNYEVNPSSTEDDDSIIQESESSSFPRLVNGNSIHNNKNMLKRHKYMQNPNDMFMPTHSEGYFQNELGYRSESGAEKDNFSIQNHFQNTQLGLKDFIDIALTTLAYLAFGMFVLQVLMCISMNKSNKIMLMPMSMDGNNTPEEIRRKRSPQTRRLLMVDNISRDIIISINRLLEKKECLYEFMCKKKGYNHKQKKKRSITRFSYNPYENIS